MKVEHQTPAQERPADDDATEGPSEREAELTERCIIVGVCTHDRLVWEESFQQATRSLWARTRAAFRAGATEAQVLPVLHSTIGTDALSEWVPNFEARFSNLTNDRAAAVTSGKKLSRTLFSLKAACSTWTLVLENVHYVHTDLFWEAVRAVSAGVPETEVRALTSGQLNHEWDDVLDWAESGHRGAATAA